MFENMCGNTCEWKKCIKIRIILFKNWKHVIELWYQMGPNTHTFTYIKINCVLIMDHANECSKGIGY